MDSFSTSIWVNDVTVRYNNGHTAIHNMTFSLNSGTICALVGVNGVASPHYLKHNGTCKATTRRN